MENRKYQSGAVSTPPSAPAIPSVGYPTNGNPGSGVNATQPGEHWFYKIGEEIRAVITGASLIPTDSDLTQLFKAIQSIASAFKTPEGTIIAFAGSAAPSGYLACPTTPTLISRVTYAALFAAIGTTWGAGDGSTTFGMPYFPAGYSAIAGTPGSTSVGAVIAHTHYMGRVMGGSGGLQFNVGAGMADIYPNTDSTGGPANLAAGANVLMCVKY
ncbi:MAG: hypothetical protein RIR39_1547 [Pseudomonadota bacterium]|jgi:hypothetical protein